MGEINIVLDDLKKIHERDKGDTLGAIANEWQQLTTDFTITPTFVPAGIVNVVYAGMGGSAVAASFLSAIPALTIPFETIRDYEIPSYVDERTLFIACSYSGGTEETIEAIKCAAHAGAQIAVITTGGTLAEIAQENRYPLILLPKDRHPRFTVLQNLRAIVTLLEGVNICTVSSTDLSEVATFLQSEIRGWLPTVPVKDNTPKQIALECIGRSVVVYAGARLAPAAYRWKMSINEGAKQVAWWGTLPEFSHNEFAGWSGKPEQKPYAVIELRSNLDHPRVQKRFELTERLLSGMRPAPIVVQAKGKTVLQQLLWTAVLGEFMSTYLALLNGYDPASLAIVDKFKRALTMGW